MSWGTSASHVPVLTLIPKLFHVERILEIGSGELSTPLFLDKVIYPKLKELVSIEDGPIWFDKITKLYGKDERLIQRSTVPAALYGYDLIFVDGPQSALKRAKTIKYVFKEMIRPIIVVHDIENKMYKKQINKEFDSFVFNFLKSPMTGVYSREKLPIVALKKYNKIMDKNFKTLEENWKGWKNVL